MRDAWWTASRVHERLRPLLSRQFAAFLLVGGTAAGAQWLSRFAFSHALPYAAAVVCAYAVGVLVAFELNRRFVFPTAPGDRRGQFMRFLAVNAVSFAVVWLVSMLFGEWLLPRFMARPWAEAVGHGVGVLSPAVLSFALHKRYTFRPQGPTE